MKTLLAIIATCFFHIAIIAQKPVKLTSPDGALQFAFRLSKNGPQYDIIYKGRPVIAGGELGLTFAGEEIFKTGLKLGKVILRNGEEKYSLVIGKTSAVQEQYREMMLPLEQSVKPFRKLNIIVRAFNDGIAFRYEFPGQQGSTEFSLARENTSFPIPGDPKVLALFLPNFTSSHEGLYSHLPWSRVKEDTLIDMPALFELPGVFWRSRRQRSPIMQACTW